MFSFYLTISLCLLCILNSWVWDSQIKGKKSDRSRGKCTDGNLNTFSDKAIRVPEIISRLFIILGPSYCVVITLLRV